jgi:hypothetical protein
MGGARNAQQPMKIGSIAHTFQTDQAQRYGKDRSLKKSIDQPEQANRMSHE